MALKQNVKKQIIAVNWASLTENRAKICNWRVVEFSFLTHNFQQIKIVVEIIVQVYLS